MVFWYCYTQSKIVCENFRKISWEYNFRGNCSVIISMAFEKLNDTDKLLLRGYQRNSKDRLAYIRVTVILMLDMGKSVDEIESILGIDASTIYRYSKSYQDKGLDEYLKTGYEGYWVG